MTARAEKAREAVRLRADGLLFDEIAARLGVSRSYAAELVDDPTGAKARARKDSYRGTCSKCGSRTDGSAGPKAAPTICALCSTRRRSEEKRWTRDAIIAAIQDWAARHGRPPTAKDWRGGDPDGRYPASTTVYNSHGREFKSWADAIEAAGFDRPRQGQRPGERWWSRELIVSELRRLAVDGVAPSTSSVPNLWLAARRYFGGWAEAIAEAGLQPPPNPRRLYWTAERIAERIRELAVDGVAPPARDPRLQGASSASYRVYGSWYAAVEAAELRPSAGRGGGSRRRALPARPLGQR